MTERVFNFNPGPATLPLPVLKQAQDELLDFKGNGMSVLEISHRSKDFENLVLESEALLKELMSIPADYRVLFLQGGASLQFSMVPMNFLPAGATADYLVTGAFAEKAYQDAQLLGNIHLAASTKAEGHNRIPRQEELKFSPSPAYVHMTTNNTIYGTQWPYIPETEGAPLVADMSSDILSRPINVSAFGLIYAGAQKNIGPSGVTVVIIREDLLKKVPQSLPSMLRYDIQAKNNSLYNTPPSFGVYIINLVLKWVKENGGLPKMEELNKQKAAHIYNRMDHSDFYRGHALQNSRSLMNVTFRLPSEELEALFISEAKKASLVGLKGHRSVGGIRASIYNAMPEEGCRRLADFMAEFQKKHG
jgi:phosphoserine aminotransferase